MKLAICLLAIIFGGCINSTSVCVAADPTLKLDSSIAFAKPIIKAKIASVALSNCIKNNELIVRVSYPGFNPIDDTICLLTIDKLSLAHIADVKPCKHSRDILYWNDGSIFIESNNRLIGLSRKGVVSAVSLTPQQDVEPCLAGIDTASGDICSVKFAKPEIFRGKIVPTKNQFTAEDPQTIPSPVTESSFVTGWYRHGHCVLLERRDDPKERMTAVCIMKPEKTAKTSVKSVPLTVEARCVAITKRGDYFLGGEDGSVLAGRMANDKRESLEVSSGAITSMMPCYNDRYLLVASRDDKDNIAIIDIATRVVIARATIESSGVEAIIVDEDKSRVVIADMNGIKILSISNLKK